MELMYIFLGNDFFGYNTDSTNNIKKKINKLDYNKLKNFWTTK